MWGVQEEVGAAGRWRRVGGGRERREEKYRDEEEGGDLVDGVAKYDNMGVNVDATSTKPEWFWSQGINFTVLRSS